jgi:hypothetical protein
MIKIEYWNSYDILDTHYEESYRNRFWLNVDVVKPEYPIFREATDDSYGDTHNIFLKWEKQYSFDLFCLENTVDFLSTLTLCDNVWITLPTGYSGKVRDFNMGNPEWTAIQSVAKVTCTFTVKAYTINGASASHC